MKCSSHGFSLIEAMITTVVISVGLLGLAGLQGTGLRNNHDAYLRSQATLLGHELLDRMRANRIQAIAGQYDLNINDTPASSSKNCESNDPCTTDEMTEFDLDNWMQSVNTSLPSGDASISTDAFAGNRALVTVTVRWGMPVVTEFSLSSEL